MSGRVNLGAQASTSYLAVTEKQSSAARDSRKRQESGQMQSPHKGLLVMTECPEAASTILRASKEVKALGGKFWKASNEDSLTDFSI